MASSIVPLIRPEGSSCNSHSVGDDSEARGHVASWGSESPLLRPQPWVHVSVQRLGHWAPSWTERQSLDGSFHNPLDFPFRGSHSLAVQMVKNLPAVQETRVWSLGQEDPLEKETAIHSSILAWRIPMDREALKWVSVHGVAKSRTQLIN